jgi:hypothetical protein
MAMTERNVQVTFTATVKVDSEIPDNAGVVECFINDEVRQKLNDIPGVYYVRIGHVEMEAV